MLMPQTTQTTASHTGSPPNRRPIVAAQVPDTAIAAIVIVVRPSRSARRPATTEPMPPAAIVANAVSFAMSGAVSGGSVSAKLAARNTPIHAHVA